MLGFDASSNNVGYARLSNFNGYVPQLISDGSLSVTVSSAIASRFLMADSVRLERAPDDVEKVYVVDNEDALGYSEIGNWATYSEGMDHRTNYRYNNYSYNNSNN